MRDIPERYMVEGVPFWTAPKVYLLGSTDFHERAFDAFLADHGFDIRQDQFCGTPAENLVEAAGRTCYLSYEPEIHGRGQMAYLENIRSSNHGSVVRHATATFLIVGVSRGLTHELVRHAAGTAISQSSSRYVDARRLGFVVPPLFRESRPALKDAYERHCLNALGTYDAAVERLVAEGEQRKPARGAARELLPIGLAQQITFTWNIQSFRHFLRMRGNQHAEKQIRELATTIVNAGKALWPQLCRDVESDGEFVELDAEI